MSKTVLLKRSNQVTEGVAKSPDSLEYGELAINYAAGYEALFAKNSENEIVNLLSNDATVAALTNMVEQHIDDENNPHNVTKAQIGLGNVDNTSDADKPISTATQTALNAKLNIASDIVDNLTTNSTVKALSAHQGIVLKQLIAEASAESGQGTQEVLDALAVLSNRVSAAEEEIDGAEAIEDNIIAKEDAMIADYAA